MKIFMVFPTIHEMSWGLSYFYDATWISNVIRYITIYAMRASHGMFLINRQVRFLITYSIEIFYFHIYHEDFYGLFNNILHVPGTRLFLIVLGTWKLDSAMWYIQNAQVMECFSSITSVFSNYLFYRNFLFSHISWRFLWSFQQYIKCPGDSVISMRIRNLNQQYAMRASDGRFISIESEFSNYLFYRNFLFSRISWRFLWSF